MNTFSAIAEEWLRKNRPLTEQQTEPPSYMTEPDDHKAWEPDFHIWMQERCASRQTHEDWGGVGALRVDFAEWSVARNEVPCTRPTLEALLRDAGFLIANGMVRGLVLKADLLHCTRDIDSSLRPTKTNKLRRRS